MSGNKVQKFVLRISATSRCQMSCSYCDRSSCNKEMPSRLLRNILLACHKSGFRVLHWTGGEPLCRADLSDLIQFARDCGYHFQKMTTNGAGLVSLAQRLKDSGLNRMNISLDTLREESYKRNTKSKFFLEVLDGIGIATSIFDNTKINVCVTHQNASEIDDFVEFSAALTTKPIVKYLELVPCGNVYAQSRKTFLTHYVPIAAVFQFLTEAYGTLVPVSAPDYSRRKCKYFLIPDKSVVCGFNPNESIHYACKKTNCMDFRINPQGFMGECSVNLENVIDLSLLSLREMERQIGTLISKKMSRAPVQWSRYQHRQKHYGFWRFGRNPEFG